MVSDFAGKLYHGSKVDAATPIVAQTAVILAADVAGFSIGVSM
jgi:hypothetical protein